MVETAHSRRLSAGVVVVNVAGPAVQYLLLRAYRNWDFPKGLVEPGEQPLDAALREVREETTLENLAFDWAQVSSTRAVQQGKDLAVLHRAQRRHAGTFADQS